MQFLFDEDELILLVKRPNGFLRGFFFFFAFASPLLPLLGFIGSVVNGNGFHFGFIIGLALFSLLGFYLLRMALWNTYGKEVIKFSRNKISYEADYGWFKDGKKEIDVVERTTYGIEILGYEDENKGALLIIHGKEIHQCVTKMDTAELEQLIEELQKQ